MEEAKRVFVRRSAILLGCLVVLGTVWYTTARVNSLNAHIAVQYMESSAATVNVEGCLTSCGTTYQTCSVAAEKLTTKTAQLAALATCSKTYHATCSYLCYVSAVTNPTSTQSWAPIIAQIEATTSFAGAIQLAQASGLHVNFGSGAGYQNAIIADPVSGQVFDSMIFYTDLQDVTSTATSTGGTSPPAKPTVTISTSPTSVTLGAGSTLTWKTTGATSCSASGSWSGTEAASGSATETPAAAGTYTYTLTCTNAGGSTAASATITVTSSSGGSGSGGGSGGGGGKKLLLNTIPASFVPTAYAQDNGLAGTTGNTTGQDAVCETQGSTNGSSQVFVNADDQVEAVSGNYQFSVSCSAGTDSGTCSSLTASAAAANTAIGQLGGAQSQPTTPGTTPENQIQVVLVPYSLPTATGVLGGEAMVQSTPSGNIATLIISQPVVEGHAIDCGYSAAQQAQYLKNLVKHEMGHALGLGHSSVSGDAMDSTLNCPDGNTDLSFNAQEVTAVQQIDQGDLAAVNNCATACPAGEAYDNNAVLPNSGGGFLPGGSCVPQESLCGPGGKINQNSSAGLFDPTTQTCQSCPDGTTPDYNAGVCSSASSTTNPTCDPGLQWDPVSNQCVDPSQCTDNGDGTQTCISTSTTPGDPTGGTITCTSADDGTCNCVDWTGTPVSPPAGACGNNTSGDPTVTGSPDPTASGTISDTGGGGIVPGPDCDEDWHNCADE